MVDWKKALELDSSRKIVGGSQAALRNAIRGGADLRIYTEFRHNEHIDTSSNSRELIKETAEFRCTYLLDDRWVAGFMTLRQPVELPNEFGNRVSMSLFLYNEDGRQAVARPFLDGQPRPGALGPGPIDDHSKMPKYHQFDSWDNGTNAPSHNFIYDFEVFRYYVNDEWREVYANDAHGRAVSGSIDALDEAFSAGKDIKAGITGLCGDMQGAEMPGEPSPVRRAGHPLPSAPADRERTMLNEAFIQLHSCYYYTDQKLFVGATQPLVRVQPAIPLAYKSGNWDFGWAIVRTDGHGALRTVDPYTLRTRDTTGRFAVRWFAR
ncbi:MAG: hypothetical protein FJ319_12170 [SAR202 cluster bacterium]|nr:hypothetical protein [SAR202 cluster bacterium]